MDRGMEMGEGGRVEPVAPAGLPGAARHKCEGCGVETDLITPYCLICQVEGEINSWMRSDEVLASRKRVRAALEAALAAPEPAPGEGSEPSDPRDCMGVFEASTGSSPSHPRASQDSQEVRDSVIAVLHSEFIVAGGKAEAIADRILRILSQSPKGAATLGTDCPLCETTRAVKGGECESCGSNAEQFAHIITLERQHRAAAPSPTTAGGGATPIPSNWELLRDHIADALWHGFHLEKPACLERANQCIAFLAHAVAAGSDGEPSAPKTGLRGAGAPGFYRKRPVVIEAFRMGIDPRPDWFTEKVIRNEIITREAPGESYSGPFGFTKTCCEIQTLEGVMRGEYGDWIIRDVKGELYPCKPDIFAATYEPAAAPGDVGAAGGAA